ncbi:DUF6891 domain-containing protein [Aquimarina algicola]|uniref:DUF6891 domain-containing protein n=1 Tax=Aquimarina algicola TaxID=2589995 RepID=A0A504JEL7_9FLAO|nr:hypothetical protein [Aquimarina algicola]TPN86875.1 hypothetical protein FHK87_04535 [Aquimarina algicola]
MTENQEFIYASIRNQVRSGLFSLEEIELNIFEEIEDNGFEKEISNEWALSTIEKEIKALDTDSEQWEKETDVDKLVKVFDALCKENIIALHCAGYTMSDGETEVVEIEVELRNHGIQSDGYCFYHQQDLEAAVNESRNLFLAFQKIDNEDEATAVAVGKRIVQKLKEYGFKTNWEETVHRRIEITNFCWKKKFDNTTRDLLDYEQVLELMLNNKK